MPTPSPSATLAATDPTAFEWAQFVVDIFSVVATTALAIAAFVVAYRGHQFTKATHEQNRADAARAERERFAAELEAGKAEIRNAFQESRPPEMAEFVRQFALARSSEDGRETIVFLWGEFARDLRELQLELNDSNARAVSALYVRLNSITAAWVKDPELSIPQDNVSLRAWPGVTPGTAEAG